MAHVQAFLEKVAIVEVISFVEISGRHFHAEVNLDGILGVQLGLRPMGERADREDALRLDERINAFHASAQLDKWHFDLLVARVTVKHAVVLELELKQHLEAALEQQCFKQSIQLYPTSLLNYESVYISMISLHPVLF